MSFDLIEGVDRFHYASNGKPTDLLYAKNQELGVEYWMETKATALLTDENGNVLDVYTVAPKTGNRYRFFQRRSQLASDRKQLHDKLVSVRGCSTVHGIRIRCGKGVGCPQA